MTGATYALPSSCLYGSANKGRGASFFVWWADMLVPGDPAENHVNPLFSGLHSYEEFRDEASANSRLWVERNRLFDLCTLGLEELEKT